MKCWDTNISHLRNNILAQSLVHGSAADHHEDDAEYRDDDDADADADADGLADWRIGGLADWRIGRLARWTNLKQSRLINQRGRVDVS